MEDFQCVYFSQIITLHYLKINIEFRSVLALTYGWQSTQIGLAPSKRKESCFLLKKKMAGRRLMWLQLTVKIQAAVRRKNQQSYIVPLQRCYIYKIISSTVLVAHVCSHPSEECFLIIQRGWQRCAELTPVEIRPASRRSIMNSCTAPVCAVWVLLPPVWWRNHNTHFSQWRILAVAQARFHGVVKSWWSSKILSRSKLKLEVLKFFLLMVHNVFHPWNLQVGWAEFALLCWKKWNTLTKTRQEFKSLALNEGKNEVSKYVHESIH